MNAFFCFFRALVFIVSYSSCTKFDLEEAEKDVQIIEKIIEDIEEIETPMIIIENDTSPI